MAVREKTVVTMNLSAVGETHARARVTTRDVATVIDEPEPRGGTNQGLTPTETLMASLVGCTNVISKRIAHKMGVEMGEMTIRLAADFDRRGVQLQEEVDVPFPSITMDIEVETNASPEELERIKSDLQRFCAVSKVIRGAGTTITENWTAKPLPAER